MNIISWLGKQHVPYSRKKLNHKVFKEASLAVIPGDVLLSRTSGELSNLVIPGFYKHAAIYYGENKVVEATSIGVHETHLADFVMKKDYLCILRQIFTTPKKAEEAAKWAFSKNGFPYDYEFRSNNEAFYCFELTYAAYNEVLEKQSPWQLRSRFGRETVVSDDFLKAKSKWSKVLEF